MSNTYTTVSVVTHNHDSSTSGNSSITSHSSSASGSSTTHVTSPTTKAPSLRYTSTAQEIAAYIAYYQERGYTITVNEQTFQPNGTIQTFRFEGTRHTETQDAGVSAHIDAASHSVSITQNSSSTTL